jgi:hypothetical protein
MCQDFIEATIDVTVIKGDHMVKQDYELRLRELGCSPPSKKQDADVGAIEAAIGVSLPSSYRDFLLKCGGWWGESYARAKNQLRLVPTIGSQLFTTQVESYLY